MNEEILERRLRKEAERRKEDVEVTRVRMLELGLDTASDVRAQAAQEDEVRADVLLVTTTLTEHRKLKEVALSLGLPFNKLPGRLGPYYKLGRIGGNRVATIHMTTMGVFGAQGSAARCIHARAETQATTLILLGTAFGADRARQRIGDVLVSERVFLYDDRRAVDAEAGGRFAATIEGLCGFADRVTSRRWDLSKKARRLAGLGYVLTYPETALRPASVTWAERFRRLAADYQHGGETERVQVGVLLSGGALIESARFLDDLVQSLPAMESQILGGEMEAAGAISAEPPAAGDEPGWIIVKGVSDFAEAGSRTKEELEKNREQAARNAARATLRALAIAPMST
jgi:adenosylhomocysteine nucleosidase